MLSRLLSFVSNVKSLKTNPQVHVPPLQMVVTNVPSASLLQDTGHHTPETDRTPSPRDSFFAQDAAGLLKQLNLPNDTRSLDSTQPPCPLLLHLPTDLLLLLADHLPIPSLLSLRLTCTSLHILLPRPTKPREDDDDDDDACALAACARHLSSFKDAQEARTRCALCKALHPTSLFRRAGILSPSLPFSNLAAPTAFVDDEDDSESTLAIATGQSLSQMSDDSSGPAPDPRICAWHINRFIFPPSAALAPDPAFDALVSAAARQTVVGTVGAAGPALGPPLMDRVRAGGWTSSVERCCMHCGRVVVCVCGVGGCGVCACDCDGCGVREVRCWWKLGRSLGHGPTRDEAGFRVARVRWLVARADESERFGWDGRLLRAERLLDWGMVRVVKCGTGRRGDLVAGNRKKKAEHV